ncbi:MAG: hypothetical protein II058_04825, partial [Rhodocyclaceae bacterium]|nr:hypothetical protein [Rhodocyclaceae bacterium]
MKHGRRTQRKAARRQKTKNLQFYESACLLHAAGAHRACQHTHQYNTASPASCAGDERIPIKATQHCRIVSAYLCNKLTVAGSTCRQ